MGLCVYNNGIQHSTEQFCWSSILPSRHASLSRCEKEKTGLLYKIIIYKWPNTYDKLWFSLDLFRESIHHSSLSLHFNGLLPVGPGLASTRMPPFWISIKQDDWGGGDNWSNKTCKAPAKVSPSTNQHPFFSQAGCPSCHPTNSVKALKGQEKQSSLPQPVFSSVPSRTTQVNHQRNQEGNSAEIDTIPNEKLNYKCVALRIQTSKYLFLSTANYAITSHHRFSRSLRSKLFIS